MTTTNEAVNRTKRLIAVAGDEAAQLRINRRVARTLHHMLVDSAEAAKAREWLGGSGVDCADPQLGYFPADGDRFADFLRYQGLSDDQLTGTGLFVELGGIPESDFPECVIRYRGLSNWWHVSERADWAGEYDLFF